MFNSIKNKVLMFYDPFFSPSLSSQNLEGKGLCLMAVATRHVRRQTCVQEWTRVRNPTGPVAATRHVRIRTRVHVSAIQRVQWLPLDTSRTQLGNQSFEFRFGGIWIGYEKKYFGISVFRYTVLGLSAGCIYINVVLLLLVSLLWEKYMWREFQSNLFKLN